MFCLPPVNQADAGGHGNAGLSFGAEMDRKTLSLFLALLAISPLGKSTAAEPELKGFTLQDILDIKKELNQQLFDALHDILIVGEDIHSHIIDALSSPKSWFLENVILDNSEESGASEYREFLKK